MARPTAVRKNLQNRAASDIQPTGLKVTQDQNVRAFQKDPRGILTALDSFGRIIEKKAADNIDDLTQQGIRDVETDAVDAELEAGNRFYRQAVNKQRGLRDGMEFVANVRQELPLAFQEAIDNGSVLDLDEFLGERLKGLYEGVEDSDQLAGINGYVNQAEQQLRGEYQRLRAEAEAAQAVDNFAGVVRAAYADGSVKTSADLQVLTEWGDEGIVFNNEIEAVLMDQALQAAKDNNLEFLDLVESHYSSKKDVMGRWGHKLSDARRAAEKRIEIEAKRGDSLAESTKALRWQHHYDRARSGEWDQQSALKDLDAGLITDGEYKTFVKEHEKYLDDQLEETRKEAVFRTALLEPMSVNALDTEDRNDVLDRIESSYEQFSNEFIQIARDMQSNPEEAQARLADWQTRIDPLIKHSQAMNYTPRVIKNFLSAEVVNSPQFDTAAALVRQLERTDGTQPFADVDVRKLARLDTYNDMVHKWGMEPEDAKAQLERVDGITEAEARALLMREQDFHTEMDSVIDDLVSVDVARPGLFNDFDVETARSRVKAQVQELATLYYRLGNGPSEAVTKSVERFRQTHMPVRGTWIPKKGIPEGFNYAFEDYNAMLQEKLQDFPEGGFHIVPRAGALLLVRADDPFTFVKDKETGEPVVVNPLELMKGLAGHKRMDAEALRRKYFEQSQANKRKAQDITWKDQELPFNPFGHN